MEPNYSNRAAPVTGVVEDQPSKSVVVAQVPQGIDLAVNVRVRPDTDIDLSSSSRRCEPRQGAQGPGMDPLDLPDDTKKKLVEADPKLMEWLNGDESNTRLFLADPLAALARAGVELTRVEQKLIARRRHAADEASVVPPGLRVTHVSVSTGEDKPAVKHEQTPERKGKRRGDCGC